MKTPPRSNPLDDRNVDVDEARSADAPWGRAESVGLALLVGGTVVQTVRWAQPSISSSDLVLGVAAGVMLAVAGGLLLPRVTGRGPAIATLVAAATMLLLITTGPANLPDGNLLEVAVGSRIADFALVAALYGAAALVSWLTAHDGTETFTGALPAVVVTAVATVLLLWWSHTTAGFGLAARIETDAALLMVAAAAFGRTHRRVLATVAVVVVLMDPYVYVVAPFHGFIAGTAGDAALTAATIAVPLALARYVGTRRPATATTSPTSPLTLLVVVNALNIADAVFTWVLLRRGTGEELNPVIGVIGLPGKVVAVAVGTYVLYRIKPESLRWALIPVASIVAYHVMGAMFVGL